MCEPRVPEDADQAETVVDQGVVDGRFAQFDGVGEELGDEQGLAFGVSSTNPIGVAVGTPASRKTRSA